MNDDKTDIELIKLYLKGSDSAFATFYERYRRQLFSYLNRMLPGQPQLADDLFQKTWMKIISRLHVYEDRQSFISWALRIAHNNVIDHFRRENRRAADHLEGEVAHDRRQEPDIQLDCGELGDAIKWAVEKLPEEQKEVFLLRQQQLSFKEIALIQETSLNTALGRMQYALKKLRDLLKDWTGEKI